MGGDVEIRFRVLDSEGESLSYRYRYRIDSVWVDADVENVGSVGLITGCWMRRGILLFWCLSIRLMMR